MARPAPIEGIRVGWYQKSSVKVKTNCHFDRLAAIAVLLPLEAPWCGKEADCECHGALDSKCRCWASRSLPRAALAATPPRSALG